MDAMATETILPITGYEGRAVPNRLRRPRGAIGRLAMLLPGFGYTLDMPLFYYVENGCLDTGIDVLRVESTYNQDLAFAAADETERSRWVTADAHAAWEAGLAQSTYTSAIVVGKSLGTLAMPALFAAPAPDDREVRSVWLTPLLSEPPVTETIARLGSRALVAIGDADPHYDAEVIRQLEATGVRMLVAPGAEHGLDLPGDVVGSVRVLERVIAAINEFALR